MVHLQSGQFSGPQHTPFQPHTYSRTHRPSLLAAYPRPFAHCIPPHAAYVLICAYWVGSHPGVVGQVSALSYLHRHAVSHADLKPSNCLLAIQGPLLSSLLQLLSLLSRLSSSFLSP
eukprot:2956959-Rhodomonas_salina.1